MTSTHEWDSARYLTTQEDVREYLQAASEYNDPGFLQEALGVAARARGMSQVAADAGLNRESLYRALSRDANPSARTLSKVAGAFGLRLALVPA